MANINENEIRCSFCGKTQEEVSRLVEGPGVYICDRCVEFCSSLIFDEPVSRGKDKKKGEEFKLLKPREIKEKLDEYVIGQERAKNIHCHFSKIEYTSQGEKKHLTFEDNIFGPAFGPLCEAIAKGELCPRIICESAGTQADDALMMKNCYNSYLEKI